MLKPVQVFEAFFDFLTLRVGPWLLPAKRNRGRARRNSPWRAIRSRRRSVVDRAAGPPVRASRRLHLVK
jgi:hypothetical protein